MADYIVNDEKTAAAAASTMNEYDIAIAQLRKIKTDLDTLTQDGYNTPSARNDFQPFVEEFMGSYEKVTEGLTGISAYVKAVGDGFNKLDTDMGASLRG
ncbi:hypothetical protein [Streptomyces sp. GQFP]|uniref:hypothetical protein n=1 Tax=Streptomyces sp. GQFP TaxID=2907545 RepID=UPI001F48CFDF|nr:hypothetical protein [Streptomyces sp. GQFP]UIX31055.1 hypothetical protein LUX31_14000 [Streptomyces sp. GQFP]